MVLFCFSWTTLGWGVTGAPEVIFSRPEIKIPFELASVQEEHWAAPQAPVVVHIQDAHGHYEAQIKIKQIIQHLKQAGGFSLLLLEGSDTRLDPSIYHFFENPDLNRRLADSLMKEGELSGAEMHLIEEMESRDRKMSAYGVENTELYRKDFRLFRETHGGKKDSDPFLKDLREGFDTVAGRFFSPPLLKAVRAWQKFQAGAELLRYALFLLGQAKKILDLDLRDPKNQREFPQIVRLIRLKDLEAAVNREEAEKERGNLSRFLKTFKAGEPFARKLEELKAGKGFSRNGDRSGLPRYFFEELYDTAAPHGFTFEAYPQFKILAQYLVLESEVDSAGLFQEINRLSEDLFFALAQDPREQEMLRFMKDVEFLKRLFSLELTREDFKRLSADKTRLSPPAMMQRLNGFNAEAAMVKNVSNETSAAFDKAAQFYGLAEKREQAFLAAIAKRMKEEGQTRAILVTGGFHGPGMADKFREKGFSFVSVSPRLSVSDEASGANYLSAMMASKKTLFDRSQISKVMTAVAENQFTADLAGMTGDPSYPRYAARQILDKATRVSPGLAGARPGVADFIKRTAELDADASRQLAQAASLGKKEDRKRQRHLPAGKSRDLPGAGYTRRWWLTGAGASVLAAVLFGRYLIKPVEIEKPVDTARSRALGQTRGLLEELIAELHEMNDPLEPYVRKLLASMITHDPFAGIRVGLMGIIRDPQTQSISFGLNEDAWVPLLREAGEDKRYREFIKMSLYKEASQWRVAETDYAPAIGPIEAHIRNEINRVNDEAMRLSQVPDGGRVSVVPDETLIRFYKIAFGIRIHEETLGFLDALEYSKRLGFVRQPDAARPDLLDDSPLRALRDKAAREGKRNLAGKMGTHLHMIGHIGMAQRTGFTGAKAVERGVKISGSILLFMRQMDDWLQEDAFFNQTLDFLLQVEQRAGRAAIDLATGQIQISNLPGGDIPPAFFGFLTDENFYSPEKLENLPALDFEKIFIPSQAKGASLGAEKKAGAAIDSLFVENPFWTDVRDRFLRLLENQYIDGDFYAELMKMENIYKAELETPLDDRSLPPIRYKVWRISHNIVQRLSKSKIKRPAKGGIRVVYPGDLAGDEYFMHALQALKKAGASVEDANRFLDNYMEEMTKALATDMSKKIALMNLLPSKSARDTRLGGGGKGSIILARIEEKNGQFVPVSLFNGRRPSRQELARIARATSRAYTEEGLVGIDLDVPAPDRGTDAVFMTWMLDEYFKVLLEHENRGVETPLRKYPGLVQFLNQEPDAIEAATVDNTPYLDRVVLYTRTKHIAVPELGTYTGKPITQGGQYSRAEATGAGALFATELLVAKIRPGNGKVMNPLTKVRVAVQGFGNAGQYYADLMARNGAGVVALSDISGGIYKRDGLSREELSRLVALTGGGRQLKDYKQADVSVDDTYLTGSFLVDIPPVDILVPAAREHVITEENAAGIKASAVVAVANGPTTMKAERILWEKVVPTIVVSDIFASGGGVAISYVEMKENRKNRYTLSHDSPMRWLRRRMARTFDEIWQKMDRKKGIDFGYAADIVAISRIQQAINAQSLGQEPESPASLPRLLGAEITPDIFVLKKEVYDAIFAAYPALRVGNPPSEISPEGYERFLSGLAALQTEPARRIRKALSDPEQGRMLLQHIFAAKAGTRIYMIEQKVWGGDPQRRKAAFTSNSYQIAIESPSVTEEKALLEKLTPHIFGIALQFLIDPYNLARFLSTAYTRFVSDLAHETVSETDAAKARRALDAIGGEWQKQYELLWEGFWKAYFRPIPAWLGFRLNADTVALRDEMLSVLNAKYPDFLKGEKPYEVTPEDYHEILGTVEAAHPGLYAQMDKTQEGRLALNAVVREPQVVARRFLPQSSLAALDESTRNEALLGMAWHAALGRVFEGDLLTDLKKMLGKEIKGARGGAVDAKQVFERFAERVTEDDFFMEARAQLTALQPTVERYYAEILANYHDGTAAGQSLGVEGEEPLQPINPALGVRLSETFYVLKGPVLNAVLMIQPNFYTVQTTFHVSEKVYQRFLRALDAQAIPAAERIAQALRASPAGYQDFADIFESRGRGAVMFLFENSLLGLSPAKRKQLFANAAFAFAANSLEDDDERYLATNFIAQLLQPMLYNMGETEFQSVDQLYDDILVSLDFVGAALLPPRLMRPVKRILDHMKANWQALLTVIEQNYDRHYVQPVAPYFGVRLSPEVVVLHHEVFSALSELFQDFGSGWESRLLSPEAYFEFLEKIGDRKTEAARQVYQAIDKTGEGRLKLELLIGPSAGPGHYFIDAEELLDPAGRSARLIGAAWQIAFKRLDLPPSAAAELNLVLDTAVGPDSSERPGQPLDFGQTTDTFFRLLAAAGARADMTAALQNEIPSVNAYYDFLQASHAKAQSLGAADDQSLLAGIMGGHFESLDDAWKKAGQAPWDIQLAGRNLMYLFGLPERNGEAYPRSELIKKYEASLADGIWIADGPDNQPWETHFEEGFGFFVSRKMWNAFADKRELAKTLVLEAISPEAARFGLDAKRIAERAAGVPLDSLAGGKGAKPAPLYLSVVNSQIAAVLRGISRDSGVAADAVLDVLDILEKAGPSGELLTLFTSKLNAYYEAVEDAMAQDFHKSGLKRLLRGSDDRFHFETVMSRVREFAGEWGVVYNAQKKKPLKFLSDAFYVEKALLSQWTELLALYINPGKEEILRQKYVEANLAHDLRVLAEEYGQIKVPAEAMRLLREAVEKTVPRDNADLYFKIKIHRILDEEPARIVKDVESKYSHWVRKFFHHNPPRESQMDSSLEATVGVFARHADALVRELRPFAKRIPKFSFVPEPEGASLGDDLSVNVSEGRIGAFYKGIPLLESTPESEREFPHELSRFIYQGPDALTVRQALLNHPVFRFDPAPGSQTTRNRLRVNWWPGPLEEHVAVTGNWHDGLVVSAKEGGVLAQYFFRISSENPKTIIFSYRGELLQDKRIRGSGFFVKVLRRILLENPAVESLIVEDAPAGLFEDVASVPKMPVEMMRAFFDPMVTLFGFLSWDESVRPEAEAEDFLLALKITRGKLNPAEKSAPVQEGASLGAPQIVLEGQGGQALQPLFAYAVTRLFQPGGELSGFDVAKILVKLGKNDEPVYDSASRTVTLLFANVQEVYAAADKISTLIKQAVQMSQLRVVLAKEIKTPGMSTKREKLVETALKRLWVSEEWQAALPQMPPYQGLDLKAVRTFVVMKSLDAKVPPPQVIPESNALRVYVSDLNKMDLAFTGSLRTILNQPPLKIEIPEWSRYLEEIFPDTEERARIIERIRKTVSWEAFDPDVLSGTRAILLHLEKPVVYRGVTYHSIKIKGIAFAAIFQPLKKPHHEGAESTSVDEAGALTHKKDVNFQGGSPASQASHEIEGMGRAFEDGVTLDIPLAHGIYPDFEMEGELGGFSVSLIQGEKDLRMEDTFNTYMRDFMPEEAIVPAHFTKILQDKGDIYGVRAHIDDFFRRAGRALRDAHDKGYYFNYPHFGNLTEYEGRFYWHDFDSWEDMRQVSPIRQIGYRFFDLFQVFNHLHQFDLFKEGVFEQFSGLMGMRPIQAILEGYFYDRLNDRRVWKIESVEDILRLRSRIAEGPVHQMDHPITGLIKDVVYKRKLSGPNISYYAPLVYVYPKQNSHLDSLLHQTARGIAQRSDARWDIFRNLGVRAISLAENYENKPIAEYIAARDEIIVAVPRGMYPGPARDLINTALYDLAVKVRETRVLAFVNRKDPEALKGILRRVSALGPNAKGGDARVQAVIDQVSKAGVYQSTAEVRRLFNPRAAYDTFETAVLDHLLESPAALGASLGAEEKTVSLYYENRGYGARNPLTAEIVTRDVTGKIIDRFLLEADEAAFDDLFAKLFEPERRDPTDASVEAFNTDLSPALAYLGIHPGEKGSPLVLEEGAAETPDDEASAKKIVQIAGPGGAVILLWDHSRHEGKKPSLRRFLDQYAGQSGVLVRDFPLETVNAADLNQALKAYELPALALSTRDEPLILEFKGEKIKFDRKLFDEHGIDPLQALALFKQIIDNPPEKRKELFFKAGLDFDAAAGYWTVSGRFVDSFLKNAYAAEAARRTLARAA